MYVDMCIDMCADMCIDICTKICIHMSVDVSIGMACHATWTDAEPPAHEAAVIDVADLEDVGRDTCAIECSMESSM